MNNFLISCMTAFIAAASGVSNAYAQTSQPGASDRLPGVYAVIKTNMGTIACKLFDKVAPLAVQNFIDLAEGTKEFTDPKNGNNVKRPYYDGTTFHRVLWDDGDVLADDKIRKLVLCSGKVYFDLLEEREKRKQKDVYILRVEQLFPFPKKALSEEMSRFKNVEEIVWCQEEPANMGPYTFVRERLHALLRSDQEFVYAGRPEAPSPAVGSRRVHRSEQFALVSAALGIR